MVIPLNLSHYLMMHRTPSSLARYPRGKIAYQMIQFNHGWNRMNTDTEGAKSRYSVHAGFSRMMTVDLYLCESESTLS